MKNIKNKIYTVISILVLIMIWVIPNYLKSSTITEKENNISIQPEAPLRDIIEDTTILYDDNSNDVFLQPEKIEPIGDISLNCKLSPDESVKSVSNIFQLDYNFLYSVYLLHPEKHILLFVFKSGLRTEEDLDRLFNDKKIPLRNITYLEAYRKVYPDSDLRDLYNTYKSFSGKDLSTLK